MTSENRTMPYMDGVTGYFVPETQDVTNQKWNDYLGGNGIDLQNAIQVDDKTIGLRSSPKGYGKLTTPEPLTIYAIIKMKQPISVANYYFCLCKATTPTNEDRRAFNIICNTSNNFRLATANNDCLIGSDIYNYHVICIMRKGDDSTAKSFLDGEYVAETPYPAIMGIYKGYYTLNEEEYWSQVYPRNSPGDVDYLALVFSVSAHTEDQIKANSDWLYKKYISNEPVLQKELKIYKNIILMNGAKIGKGETVKMYSETNLTSKASTATMPNMDGITGYFIPETQDLDNQVWSDYLGGNGIDLENAVKADNAIGLRKSLSGRGKYYTSEPLIIYAIMKFASNGSGVTCPLTKGLTAAGYSKAFNILGLGNAAFIFSAGSNDASIVGNGDSYHVMCIVRNGDNSPVKNYSDGVYISQSSNVSMIDYSGYFLLNDEEFGPIRYDSPWDFDYLMLAFGSKPHSAEEIAQNSEYLRKKYISAEPVEPENPDISDNLNGIRVYRDIVLMNGAKIYNEDGTEYIP